jgi:hypothetical protein
MTTLARRRHPVYAHYRFCKADLCLKRFFDLVDLTLAERVDRSRVPGNIDSRE